MSKHLIAAAIAALVLNACGNDPQSPQGSEPPQQTGNEVFKPYTDALDRAKGVEATLQQGVDRQRQSLEGQQK